MRSTPAHATPAAAEQARDDVAPPLSSTPSKTRRKQQMHALQALGERLVALPQQQLDALTLPEELAAAVHEARRTRTHEGLRRQLQYVGKRMRHVDADAIAAQLADDDARHDRDVQAMHAAERWRDGLLDGSASLTAFIERHPAAATAGLPEVLAQARRERAGERPPRAQRLLYRELHRLITGRHADPGTDEESPP